MTAETDTTDGRFVAFSHVSFRRYWSARTLTAASLQIMSVSAGWQIYDMTRNPFDLGLVGLVQFTPPLLLVLFTGAAADRFGRRLIMALAAALQGLCGVALLAVALVGTSSIAPILTILFVYGIARAFFQPAASSLVGNVVPLQHFPNAVAWNSSSWQSATVIGPVIGGLLYGFGPQFSYGAAALTAFAAATFAISIPKPPQAIASEKPNLAALFAGFRYIWKEKVVLGAISLDLFAVLLAGAVALMPVFARDILELGPWGLGLLRASPAFGAIVIAVILAGRPIRDHAGSMMLLCVGLFGFFNALFGFSTTPWLSIVALAGVGAADMVSVFVRQSLIQLWTPDELRGRVNAVNSVFTGATTEIGAFRAGSTAALIGTGPAVILGGVAAVGVAGLWAVIFPQLRQIRHLTARH